ncbi:MAG: hypothetical protein O3A01_08200 [bacterium]|nr:hypothetical protein [bacterium]
MMVTSTNGHCATTRFAISELLAVDGSRIKLMFSGGLDGEGNGQTCVRARFLHGRCITYSYDRRYVGDRVYSSLTMQDDESYAGCLPTAILEFDDDGETGALQLIGELNASLRLHGKGRLVRHDYILEGDWDNGVPAGTIRYQSKENELLLDFDASGVLKVVRHSAGGVYTGDFDVDIHGAGFVWHIQNGYPSGDVHIRCFSGVVYDGEMTAGSCFGRGFFVFPNGTEMCGDFNSNQLFGYGEVWSQDTRSFGFHCDNELIGLGVLKTVSMAEDVVCEHSGEFSCGKLKTVVVTHWDTGAIEYIHNFEFVSLKSGLFERYLTWLGVQSQ